MKIKESKLKSALNKHRKNTVNKSDVERIIADGHHDFTCIPKSEESLDDLATTLRYNIEQMANEVYLYEQVAQGNIHTIDLTTIVQRRLLQENSQSLIVEATNGNTQRVKDLIPVSDPTMENSQALRFAARSGHTDIVQLLIPVSDLKANATQALWAAAQEGHVECVKLLIPVADPKAQKSEALQLATMNGHIECVKLLIPVSDPKAGQSASLQWALQLAKPDSNHLECVKLLIPVSNCDEVLSRLQEKHKNVLITCMEEYDIKQQKERLLNRLHRVADIKNNSNKRKI